MQAAIDELAVTVHPDYDDTGIQVLSGITLNSGGYYVDADGVCHIDLTLTPSVNVGSGGAVLNGFPPASVDGTSPNYYIGTPMNSLSMAHQSGYSYSLMKSTTGIGSGVTSRFIGTYQTTIIP